MSMYDVFTDEASTCHSLLPLICSAPASSSFLFVRQRTPASPSEFDLDTGYLSSPEYSEGHYQQNNWNRHPHPYSLDLSSSSYAAASAAMSPISVLPMSPAFSSSRLSLGKGSNKGKSRSRLAVDLTDDMPPRSSGEEIGGWDPYLKAKGKGKQKEVLERRILEPGEYALPADTGERERLKGLSPPPRVKRESVDGDASGRSTPEGGMRRWTMAFGDEDEEEASSGPVRVRTNTKTSGRSRSRAGSAVMSMMSWPEGSTTDGGYPSTLSGVDGEGDDGLQMEEMGVVGMGIALTTSPSMEGSLQSGTRWRCSYNPRGSGMVYGVQDDDDDEEDDEEEDEVWGEGREEWLEIRKVKMCCRELVRTERNYLRCLRDLMGGEVRAFDIARYFQFFILMYVSSIDTDATVTVTTGLPTITSDCVKFVPCAPYD
ncbi:hypothetical protein OE88DRAFT_59611 [Heliocybe sulcata]|uniref:DH domain-containing protein n=1 Tax=Heliocybe sulcata TaxID=5364 RepID=A0A5C3NHE1_9AGAM|nr:hypothetical protein OE88DRAFT_59611 [Heliocybe sulcata]